MMISNGTVFVNYNISYIK